MKKDIKRILVAASCFFLVYVAIHFKNYLQVGKLFIVIKDDVFDKCVFYINLPGQIPAFLLIITIFQNIHNYPWWFSEGLSLILNCIIYGYVFGKIVPTVFARLKRMKESV